MLVIDYIVIALSLLVSLYFGRYFSKKQTSTHVFFTTGGRVPAWAVGMSILATLISSVTFIAYPGAGYLGKWILLVQAIMVVIVLSVIVWFVVPLYRKVIKISTYEYFEKRFGFLARIYSSLAFAFTHFSKMGTVFFLLSLPISKVINLNPYLTVWLVGFIVIYVAVKGGMEAIIWLDAIQGFLLILGGILSVTIILFKTPGGITAISHLIEQYDKINFGPYDLNFAKLTFIVMALNGIFYGIQKYATDQTIVQRYLTTKTDKDAIKAALTGVYLSLPVWTLFMLIGTLLFAYYKINPGLPSNLKAEEVFIYFMMNELPVVIKGLVISALIAAAISSLDSDLNSLSAVVVEDYYKRFKPHATEEQKLKFAKIVILITGVASLLIATLYVASGSEGILGIVFGLYAIFSGGIAGIFLLGIFSKRANKKGLYIAIIACILFTAWATLTTTKINDKPIINLGKFNFPHHTYMIGVYSHLIIIFIGYIASLFFKSENVDENITIYPWLKNLKSNKNETA